MHKPHYKQNHKRQRQDIWMLIFLLACCSVQHRDPFVTQAFLPLPPQRFGFTVNMDATQSGYLPYLNTRMSRRTLPQHWQTNDASDIIKDNSDNAINQDNLAKLVLSKRQLTRDFLNISVPAFIQLTAEPLAGLVDTVYLGRLGPDVLGGAGVAISAHYAVSKLYNDPLLRTTISLVASQDGKTKTNNDTDSTNNNELSIAVSSALLLAVTVGIIQCVVYILFCHAITKSMGVSPSSAMWHSAVSYLNVRALGSPAATLWLVSNGIFRGLGDTRTPLIYSFVFTILNAVLDPLFIFGFHYNASGAAAGTALAQYIALIPLLRALHRKVPIQVDKERFRDLKSCLRQYVHAGGLVLVRTFGKVTAYAVCARQAALLGSVAAAAYNLTFQLGFATTQICEAVAVAVQTLLARELAKATKTNTPTEKTNDTRFVAKLIRHLITISTNVGGGVAITLSLLTYLRRDWVVGSLTTNSEVQQSVLDIFPVVLITQIAKGLAYPVNGILMGGLDWFVSMTTMWIANLVCIGTIFSFATAAGSRLITLNQIWWALAAFMGTQVVTGIIRYESKTGVWSILRHEQ